MAGVVLSFYSVLVGAMLMASATEAIIFKYNVDVAGAANHFDVTLTANDTKNDLSGTGLWKMSVFVSQNGDPKDTSTRGAYKEQALSQPQQDQSVQANVPLTFTGVIDYAYADMGGCENDFKYVCVVFGQGDKPDPSFDLLNTFETCLQLSGLHCLGDTEKPVIFGASSWSFSGGTITYTQQFLASSRQNLEGSGLWKLLVGFASEANPASSNIVDQHDVLSAEQSSTSLVKGQTLTFSASLDTAQLGCSNGQYQYLCIYFGRGDTQDYAVSNSVSYCTKAAQCEEEM